ncbi:MAG: hypothetical protein J6K32_11160 [Clostridia bacterium]|nr:hypothetical protein [Clostridia bacterium]
MIKWMQGKEKSLLPARSKLKTNPDREDGKPAAIFLILPKVGGKCKPVFAEGKAETMSEGRRTPRERGNKLPIAATKMLPKQDCHVL